MRAARTHRWSAIARAAALILACLLSGCREPQGPHCYPVHGQVQQAGKPLAEALVVFYPLDVPPVPFPKPTAHTDGQGRYELTTFTTGDGAPAGRYAVTVELRAPRQVGEEIVRDGPSVLPQRYAQAETSGLRAEVTAGENELPPLVVDEH
ncbi:MAG: hypothetical protein WD845_03175 [Pirellulales bacterium]